jgi:hypothetical protein
VSEVNRMIPNQGGSEDESTHWKAMINLSRTPFGDNYNTVCRTLTAMLVSGNIFLVALVSDAMWHVVRARAKSAVNRGAV